MERIEHKCRLCNSTTGHIERVVDDKMPAYTKCLQCTRCGELSVVLMADAT